jgi:YHS domain-containing protein
MAQGFRPIGSSPSKFSPWGENQQFKQEESMKKRWVEIGAVLVICFSLSMTAIAQMDHSGHGGMPPQTAAPAAKVKDPVCGMEIEPGNAAGKSKFNKKTYYFCSADDKAKFEKEPEKYVKK